LCRPSPATNRRTRQQATRPPPTPSPLAICSALISPFTSNGRPRGTWAARAAASRIRWRTRPNPQRVPRLTRHLSPPLAGRPAASRATPLPRSEDESGEGATRCRLTCAHVFKPSPRAPSSQRPGSRVARRQLLTGIPARRWSWPGPGRPAPSRPATARATPGGQSASGVVRTAVKDLPASLSQRKSYMSAGLPAGSRSGARCPEAVAPAGTAPAATGHLPLAAPG
jgi:hypothetical protein